MIAEIPTPKPAASFDEWQGVAALLALREERRLRRLAALKDLGAIMPEREVCRPLPGFTPEPVS